METTHEAEVTDERSRLLGNQNGQAVTTYNSTSTKKVIKKAQAENGSAQSSPVRESGRSRRTVRKWIEDKTMLGILS